LGYGGKIWVINISERYRCHFSCFFTFIFLKRPAVSDTIFAHLLLHSHICINFQLKNFLISLNFHIEILGFLLNNELKLEDHFFFEKIYLLNISIFADIIFNSEKMTKLKRQIKCAYLKKIDKLYTY